MRAFTVPVVVALAAGLLAPVAVRGEEKHPRMHQSLYELKEARKELKEAAHDFGGHREDALKAVDAAIIQIDKALTGAKDKFTGGKAADEKVYKKHDLHPHIHHALHELKEARKELKDAGHDFGGHREQAIKDVDYAIEQLELALKFDKK